MFKKLPLFFGLLVIASLVLAACGGAADQAVDQVADELIEESAPAEEEAMVEEEAMAEEEAPVAEGESDIYRIAIFEDPISTNYWNYLGPGNSVWTSYIVAGQGAALYTLSDERFDFVTSLATELVSPVQEGDVWTMTVPMVEGAIWSDGEPITANDVAFTQNACIELQLTSNWPNQCQPSNNLGVEAVDDYTVKFTFDSEPGLGVWNAGVALAPVLPEHYWGDAVAEASAFIEGVEEPAIERPEDCAEGGEGCDEWAVYDEAYENARVTLYEADASGAPTAGGYNTDQFEPGAFVQRSINNDYFFAGATTEEFDDGTWRLTLADGTVFQLYGEASGEKTLEYLGGPYAPNILFSIYSSQDAAFLALRDGEVDYVMNPLGLSRGLKEQALAGEGIKVYQNADYGMFYLAFNMRKEPFGDLAFRQAMETVIDKEFVVNSVLAGVVFPMYSTMPPGNAFWYKDVNSLAQVEDASDNGTNRDERVNSAVQILKDAGYTWTTEPVYDEDLEDVIPGEGFTLPNGQLMQEFSILGPGPSYDPLRATFNQWISEWWRELGIPVQSELTGFNTILNPVFVDADFDVYILGWSLGNVAYPDYYFDFWHSENDTAVTGNFNTPGYNNPEYDALADEFKATSDIFRAQELVYEMQDVLARDLPYIPLFYKSVEDLARDNVIFPYTNSLGGIESLQGIQSDTFILSK